MNEMREMHKMERDLDKIEGVEISIRKTKISSQEMMRLLATSIEPHKTFARYSSKEHNAITCTSSGLGFLFFKQVFAAAFACGFF
jgi:hypothetical protein